jgi:predicted RNase H-like HicB family nuclease
MRIEFEREDTGRWIGEIPDLLGVMAYGDTRQEAYDRVTALAFRVLADRIEQGEKTPNWSDYVFSFHDSDELRPRV